MGQHCQTVSENLIASQKVDRTYASQPAGSTQSVPLPSAKKALKRIILVFAASPADQARLRLDTEVREIDQGLRLSQQREQFDLQQRWAVRPNDLRRALLGIQPQVLRFCEHGEDTAGLVLEDGSGNAKLVSTAALTSLFQLFSSRGLECLVLNACYSEIQADAIAQHIPYVIGINNAIGDTVTIKFSVGFYDALRGGWSYPDAYRLGCNAIALAGSTQDLTPVLKNSAR